MIDIYIKDYNRNGSIIGSETLIQSIPAASEGGLRFISPIVKAEMGTPEGFDFSIESGTPFYDAFLQMKTFIRVVFDGTTIFYGRVLTIDNNGFRGTRKVRCEGPLAFLMDSPVEGVAEEKRKSISTYDYMSSLISNHNSYINNEANKVFRLGEVPGNYSGGVSSEQRIKNDTRTFGSDSWTDTKSALEDLRSHYGGFFRARPAGGIGSGIYLDWMNHYFNPTTISQKIEVGKNILDISNVTEIDNVFTAIIPIGKHNVTTSTNGTSGTKQEDLYIDGKILRVPDICSHFSSAELNEGYHRYEHYRDAISKYGMIIKQVSFPDATDKTKLYNEACEWIRNNYQGEVTKFTIKAIDMRQIGENTSKINVGDRVTIIYPVAKEDGTFPKQSTTQTCLSIQYDLYHPENNSYTFGIPANILTKTYGLKKQAKSVQSASTTPKATSSGAGGGRAKDWFRDYVKPWLQNHKLRYNPPKKEKPYYPYTETYKQYMFPLTNRNEDYLWWSSGKKVIKGYKSTDPTGKTGWSGALASYDLAKYDHVFTEKVLYDYHVLDYVYYEYGIDLTTYWKDQGITAPTEFTDSEGKTYTWNSVVDTLTGLKDFFISSVLDPLAPLGEAIWNFFTWNFGTSEPEPGLTIGADGKLNWYYKDPVTGEVKTMNNRDLTIYTVDTEYFKGQMIKDGYVDAAGNLKPHQFGLSIENYLNGKLVVARVEGDVVQIGDEGTLWHTTVAKKISGNFLNPVEFIIGTDPLTGEAQTIRVGDTGQLAYTARWDDEQGCYVYDPNGNVTITGDGFWDTKNLAIKGGIYTVQDPDTGKYTSYVRSSQLVIGGPNDRTKVITALMNSGVLNENYDPQKLVENSIYTENLFAINAHFDSVEANYLRTNMLSSEISKLKLVNVRNITAVPHIGSNCSFEQYNGSYYYGNNYYINIPGGGGSVTYKDLKDCIDYVYVTNNGAITTLHMHKASGSDLDPSEIPEGKEITFKNYTGGWNAAAGRVSMTTSMPNTSNTIYVYYPPSTVDGSTALRTYYLASHDKNTVDLYTNINGSETTVARWTHGNYNSGWSAAAGRVSMTTSMPNTSNTIYVYYPPSTVDGSTALRTYYLASHDKNTVDLYTNINGSETTVARWTHGNYNSGWSAAVGRLVIPTSKVENSNTIVVKYPPSTVDGSASSTSYWIENNDDDSVNLKCTGGTTVARYTHGKYSSGKSAGIAETKNGMTTLDYSTSSNGEVSYSREGGYNTVNIKVTVPHNISEGGESKSDGSSTWFTGKKKIFTNMSFEKGKSYSFEVYCGSGMKRYYFSIPSDI